MHNAQDWIPGSLYIDPIKGASLIVSVRIEQPEPVVHSFRTDMASRQGWWTTQVARLKPPQSGSNAEWALIWFKCRAITEALPVFDTLKCSQRGLVLPGNLHLHDFDDDYLQKKSIIDLNDPQKHTVDRYHSKEV